MRIVTRLSCLITVVVVIVARSLAAADIDFSREVRPILSDKCYACHGPDKKKRRGGDKSPGGLHFDTKQGAFSDLGGYFAIVPGQPDKSELVLRIRSTEPDEVMPPADYSKQLTAREKRLLADWIKQGASWQDHWAYVVPKKQPAPKTHDRAWPRNVIDAFVLARLEQAKLTASPEADKRTLLRRVSFDIAGLPPNAKEIRAFLADKSPRAFEKVVDRLLESPQYGERMAIYWLDLVRYADSVGYHGDQPVSVSPYRDYVINAFNTNMPFDRFTREQLAGDLLPDPSRAQLIASGYNRLGMMSAEGGVQPKEYLAKYMSDRVRTSAAVWLGSTLICAECHEHKYDPFTTADFYRLASFFAGIQERGLYAGAHASGNWGPKIDVPDDKLPELLKPVEGRLKQLQAVVDTPTQELAEAQRKWEANWATAGAEWEILKPASVKAMHGTQLKILNDQSILAAGANPNQNTYTVTTTVRLKDITGFRLEVLADKSLPKNGPGRVGNGNFVVTEFRVLQQSPDGAEPKPIALQNASATFEQTLAGNVTPYKKWNAASAIDGDAKGSSWGWAVLPEVGKPQNMVAETVTSIPNGDETTLTFVIEQNHTNPKHTVGRFRLAATSAPRPLKSIQGDALPRNVQPILALATGKRNDAQQKTLAAYYRSIAPSLTGTRKQIDGLNKRKAQIIKQNTRTSLITVAVEPRMVRVLPRGNWMDDSGQIVAPGVPHFLRQIRNKGRANRADLADWLTAKDNPLTARVFVNRLWKLFFGTGLSKVLDDVGAQGEPPTHPELLDRLAVEFIESGWDIKHMVKLIALSNTYRQSSLMRTELRDVDPYNRLLARQSRFRLDAEMVRDNALSVSGLLVLNLGGRSVKPYQPVGLYRHLNFPQRTYKHDTGQNQYRRGLYTHWQRQFLHPAMKAFDAPPREECTAERPRSNTPLGALVLLNDPSYVEAARVLAASVIKQDAKETLPRLKWMMQQALSRDPNAQEVQILDGLLKAHLLQYKKQPAEAKQLVSTGLSEVPSDIDIAELAAWTSVVRTVFNMHEFITRN